MGTKRLGPRDDTIRGEVLDKTNPHPMGWTRPVAPDIVSGKERFTPLICMKVCCQTASTATRDHQVGRLVEAMLLHQILHRKTGLVVMLACTLRVA